MVDTGVSIVIPKNECVRIDLLVEGKIESRVGIGWRMSVLRLFVGM